MKAVFLDRDGVINKYPGDGSYVTRVSDLHILPGVLLAVRRLKQAKYKVFIISNQACVGRGIISQTKLDAITAKLLKAASLKKIKFDGIFYCTHAPDQNCDCRKPGIGNVKKALATVGKKISSVKQGFFVGDTIKDVQAGITAGFKTILVETGRERIRDFKGKSYQPHYVAENLNKAVDIILNQ